MYPALGTAGAVAAVGGIYGCFPVRRHLHTAGRGRGTRHIAGPCAGRGGGRSGIHPRRSGAGASGACASYSRHGFRRRSAAAGQRAPDSISTARRLCGGVSKARRMPLLKKRRASVMQNGLSFKNTMSRVGLCYFVLMLVTQALQLAGMTLLGSLLETGWGLWALSYAPLYCIAVPVFILLLQKLVPGTPGTAGSAALTAGGWLRWLVLCLGVTYLFNFVSLGITALLGMLKGGAVQNPLALMQMNSSPLATFLFACVLAPVGEEFLFRKLLYDKIGGYGVRTYVLVGAFLFALFHANLSQLLYAFVLGAVFCYIYAHTGKLRYTILLHVAINTIGTMAAPLFIQYGGIWGTAAVGILVLVSIAAGAVIAARRRWRFPGAAPADGREGEGAQRPAHSFGRALRTPGMLAYTGLCAALILVVTFLT
ncbi:CPBP family intramembrane metalloprotease [Ruthenibacterium lactatiformans]|nr:CPBP family intramembrane metalloprotease [Ruthenibacterium lactatiformans]MTS69125.1 CPBP family intramembrane metalloprotease [Ruthenibacterium lactatiformans]MTS78260.1 CPBP family intramembrane metalloprotease [Ruthenibacterium lactatiformans]